jgi:hypothetical protein
LLATTRQGRSITRTFGHPNERGRILRLYRAGFLPARVTDDVGDDPSDKPAVVRGKTTAGG